MSRVVEWIGHNVHTNMNTSVRNIYKKETAGTGTTPGDLLVEIIEWIDDKLKGDPATTFKAFKEKLDAIPRARTYEEARNILDQITTLRDTVNHHALKHPKFTNPISEEDYCDQFSVEHSKFYTGVPELFLISNMSTDWDALVTKLEL